MGLIGPSEAGRTTVFEMQCGCIMPRDDNLRGESLADFRPFRNHRSGSVRADTEYRLFPSLSVFDNVRWRFFTSNMTPSITVTHIVVKFDWETSLRDRTGSCCPSSIWSGSRMNSQRLTHLRRPAPAGDCLALATGPASC